MPTVVLFHHALGLTPGLQAIAERLTEGGHDVVTPDLFEGQRFASLDDGVAHAEEIGFDTVSERGIAAAESFDGEFVVVGFSLGVLPAQRLAQTDPRVIGAVLCDAAIPLGVFAESWPSDVQLELHAVDGDPWMVDDLDAARALADAADGELFLYPGSGHVVADASSPHHDPDVAEQLIARIIGFVDRLSSIGETSADRDEFGRPQPPLQGDESSTLLGFLDNQRATLAWKCRDLDRDGLATTIGSSTMTLGGLLKHLAYVEDDWSHGWLHGIDRPDPWETIDWNADPDWEWHSTAEDTPDELLTFWQRSVRRSQQRIDKALANGGLDTVAARSWPDERAPSLRWIIVHLIEEYARHNGHADLLRESVDGATGE